jgi:uncharacterized Zn finger protein (UPF0148 family)
MKTCGHCGAPLPADAHGGRGYCNQVCHNRANTARKTERRRRQRELAAALERSAVRRLVRPENLCLTIHERSKVDTIHWIARNA